jgi:hypothetical protein
LQRTGKKKATVLEKSQLSFSIIQMKINPKFTSFSVGDYLEKTYGWGKCTECWYKQQ